MSVVVSWTNASIATLMTITIYNNIQQYNNIGPILMDSNTAKCIAAIAYVFKIKKKLLLYMCYYG